MNENQPGIYGYSLCRKKEFRDIFKHSTFIGLALLSFNIVAFIFKPFIYYSIMFLSGVNKTGANKLLQSESFVLLGINVFLTAIIFTGPFIFAAKIMKYKVTQLISFKPRKGTVLPMVLIALGFFAAGEVITSFVSSLFSYFGKTPTAPDLGSPKSIWELIFCILAGAGAPALLEEFAFRGIVLNSLLKFGTWPAVIVSSLLFGVMHGNFVQIPFAFCAGIGLALCYIKSNSIWPGVIAHFINNSVSFLLVYISSVNRNLALIGVLTLVMMFLSGAIGFTLYYHKNNKFFKLSKAPSCYSSAARVGLIIVSPLMLISILVFLAEAVFSLIRGA